MMDIPLRTRDLTKVYNLGKKRSRIALDGLDIEVPQGVIFGFLGPNGAGKTTTIKMILDFIRPTGGTVEVFGKPSNDIQTRSMIGYLPEQPYFPRFLTPAEVLTMHAALAGLDRREIRPRLAECLERVGIAGHAETPLSKLSKGLAQRVGIAQALIGDPKLLILDEPTSGLDPIGRRVARDLLIGLRDEGKTIFLSSHLLGEVESICDVVAVLKEGKLTALGPPREITSPASEIIARTTALDKATIDQFRFLDVAVERAGECSVLRIDPKNVYEVMRAMEELRLPVIDMETRRESLEEAFLRLAA